MPTIFPARTGTVIALQDPASQLFVRPLVNVEEDPIGISTQRSIVTRVVISQEANYQFLHTIGSDIYVYVFGDRVGQMTLSGLSFNADCDSEGTEHGVEQLLDWYKTNKLSSRRTPMRVMVGSVPITAFVVGMTNDVIDPQARIVQYNLALRIIPERNTRQGRGTPLAGEPSETPATPGTATATA